MTRTVTSRSGLVACTAVMAIALTSAPAVAQDGGDQGDGLGVIVVTAQKREQSLQEVPIAVTALGGEALLANRVTTVGDLNGLAPGVTVRTVAGGTGLPGFTIRGASSITSVAGADKQISTYLDGVYISSPRGGIFDLPDLARIEVLRGPQGTLFGRNATAGAISIITRDPTGEVGVRAEVSVGNYDHYRFRTSVDLPQVGPLSGYVSFVHDYRRGGIRNAGAGAVWDRTASPDPLVSAISRSPKWLGTKDSDSVFAALKFESGDFTTVYKFDWAKASGTPEGTGFVAINADAGPAAAFLNALINSQEEPVNIAPDGKRPKVVNNSYVIPSLQKNLGHNLTSTLQLTDNLSIKNIAAYRKAHVYATSSIDGLSGLALTAQAAPFFGLPDSLVGSPFLIVATQQVYRSEQWSDEIQLNYDSDLLTLTAGGLWFKSKDTTNTHGFQSTLSFRPVPGGVIPLGNQTETFNKATSIAAYAQVELHLTPQLDVVGGVRLTHDRKSGRYIIGTAPDFSIRTLRYRDTRPSFLVGVNYRPSREMMFYAKYSTAFVSGGSIAGFEFLPEKAQSVEGGIKAELFDSMVQANLAIYWAQYKNYQSVSTATLVDEVPDEIGSFIVPLGTIESTGFELDVTAAPVRGVTLGGSLSYSDTKASDINPLLLSSNDGHYVLTNRPDWTAGLWGQYQTEAVIGDAYLTFRADATWQSESLLDNNPRRSIGWAPAFPEVDSYWTVNGRIALRDLDLGGVNTQVALWAKNLTDTRAATFGINLFNTIASANYLPPRTYGVDFIIDF